MGFASKALLIPLSSPFPVGQLAFIAYHSDYWGLMAVEELLRNVTVAVARSLEVVGDSVKVLPTVQR